MSGEKCSTNKWYILYTLIPMIFFIGLMVTVKLQPNTDATITIYGVKHLEHEKVAGFKIKQMTLTNGEMIYRPTLDDIREHQLLTYHNSEELANNQAFPISCLN